MEEKITKLFKHDRNYILKEAQYVLQKHLLKQMINQVKNYYLKHYNPLGLEDDTVLKIKNTKKYNLELFYEFYRYISAVYRFQNIDNQLELIFDGKSHFEKFSEEWEDSFGRWIQEFCKHECFIKAVLEAAVFYEADRKGFLAFNRLKNFVTNHFEIRIYKRKGLVPMRVA